MTEKLRRFRVAESRLQKCARLVSRQLPAGVGFALVCFTHGAGGYSGYVSDLHRDDMIKALRECADVLEARRDVKPGDPIPELH